MAKKYKDKHFYDTANIYCEKTITNEKGFSNCNIYYWEQGLIKKIKERFQVRVKIIHMGDVIESQIIDAEKGNLSISLKRGKKDDIINTTHCYLVGFKSHLEHGKIKAEASELTCIPEFRHVDDKS